MGWFVQWASFRHRWRNLSWQLDVSTTTRGSAHQRRAIVQWRSVGHRWKASGGTAMRCGLTGQAWSRCWWAGVGLMWRTATTRRSVWAMICHELTRISAVAMATCAMPKCTTRHRPAAVRCLSIARPVRGLTWRLHRPEITQHGS